MSVYAGFAARYVARSAARRAAFGTAYTILRTGAEETGIVRELSDEEMVPLLAETKLNPNELDAVALEDLPPGTTLWAGAVILLPATGDANLDRYDIHLVRPIRISGAVVAQVAVAIHRPLKA